jgi:hypothetical protein
MFTILSISLYQLGTNVVDYEFIHSNNCKILSKTSPVSEYSTSSTTMQSSSLKRKLYRHNHIDIDSNIDNKHRYNNRIIDNNNEIDNNVDIDRYIDRDIDRRKLIPHIPQVPIQHHREVSIYLSLHLYIYLSNTLSNTLSIYTSI